MSEDRVIIERDGAVAHVKLNRPDKRNGLDLEMFEGLIDAGTELSKDPTLRAVVLSGEGKAFCAGLDFMAFMAAADVGQKLLSRPEGSPANLAQRAPWVWREVPVPVIAAVHGYAFGGGLQLALAADLRYVHPDAQMSVMEIRYGLIPDMGASQTLLGVVPLDVAKELTWTGRRVGAEEAMKLGLCTKITKDPVADALETAKLIAGQSPHAIRAGKQLFEKAAKMSVEDAFLYETELQLELLGSKNQLEAVQASFTKRTPNFDDPA